MEFLQQSNTRDYLRSLSSEEVLVQLALGSLSEWYRWELVWLSYDINVLTVLAKDVSPRVQANAAYILETRLHVEHTLSQGTCQGS